MKPRRVSVFAAAAAGALAVLYRRDEARALERLHSFDVRTVETPSGPVEYTEWDDGKPILVIHGVVGGWDVPSSWLAFVPDGYRSIAPARFGYLGSAMPEGATPALQADAFAALLDALEIDRLPVLAFSAGSTSAVQLALQHPERVTRLALLCANSPHPEPLELPPRALAPLIFSQPALWAVRRFARPALRRIAGFPPEFEWDDRARREEAEIMNSFFPVGLRTQGIVFDAYVSNPAIATYPLEEIALPTIGVHAADDPLASYDDARAMAKRIPGARFVSVPRGGHVFMHRDANALAEVHRFLAAAPSR